MLLRLVDEELCPLRFREVKEKYSLVIMSWLSREYGNQGRGRSREES